MKFIKMLKYLNSNKIVVPIEEEAVMNYLLNER